MIKAELTEEIIASFYKVYNNLGYGHLEKVYEKALLIELNKRGLKAISQYPIDVYYDGILIGKFFGDLIVENDVLVELKSASCIIREHEIQLINYLKSTEFEVGFIFNFGRRPQFKRRVFSNSRKKHFNDQ